MMQFSQTSATFCQTKDANFKTYQATYHSTYNIFEKSISDKKISADSNYAITIVKDFDIFEFNPNLYFLNMAPCILSNI